MKITLVGTILLGAASATALVGGCSSAGSTHESNGANGSDPTGSASDGTKESGTIGLSLQVGTGVTLSTLSYTITGPGGFSRMGTIDVSNSTTISAIIGGIPFGNGYLISLSGKSVEGTATCAGSASFNIVSAATTPVAVHIACAVQPGTGTIAVNGMVNVCPIIDSVGASPAEVTTGNSLALSSAAVDPDNGPSPLAFSWTASSGTLTNAGTANPTFTCAQAGTATITLTAFDGDATCASHQSVNVTCTEPATASPIKHVIVLIGENRSFDHAFGTHVPRAGQTISNLLSKGIVNADGTPGPNFALSAQSTVTAQTAFYVGTSAVNRTPYAVLPAPTTNGAPSTTRATSAPFTTVVEAAAVESDLDPADLVLATTGATGLPARSVDTRIPNAANLPNGSFQMTGPTMPYDAYTGDLTHRFYQMWQQEDCDISNATASDPAGCAKDLFPFVLTSFSTAENGDGNPMEFTNVQNGDMAFFEGLANAYSMSDNFHQSVMGGTGANHSMIGFGDAVPWTDGMGNPVPPPTNQIANPNPKAGTNNNYTVDGAFSNCSDPTAPGVGPIENYLASLPYTPNPRCAPNTYYYLNNTNPAYNTDGTLASGTNVPPVVMRSIGDSLSDKSISWRFYGGAFNRSLVNESGYCSICNPFQYQTRFMADPVARTTHIKDTADMYSDIANGTLPAVSFAHPDGTTDGHPQSSKLDLYEAYVKNILNKLAANPALQASTVVIVTFDEGGGYFDSGFVQPLDFFGDGTRIPMIAVSQYTKGGNINHSYADQVSILKFIERNWSLAPITSRSRDNFPNPVVSSTNAYIPTNSPALDDLFDMFDFSQSP
jgi:phospholipase C